MRAVNHLNELQALQRSNKVSQEEILTNLARTIEIVESNLAELKERLRELTEAHLKHLDEETPLDTEQ